MEMNSSQSAKPAKILFVITQGERGGAQRYVFDLAAHLPRDRFSVSVVAGPEKSELRNLVLGRGGRFLICRNLIRDIHPLKDLLAIRELRKIFAREKPDIVHLNSSKAGVVGSVAARLAGVKRVVFTAHGFAFLEPNSWWRRQIYYWAERFATYFRDKIICVSECDRQAALRSRLGPAEKFITIHNGIATVSLPPPTSHLTPPFVVGAIAHLYPTKGLNHLVDAARDIDAKFVIIGEGPERANLESRIKNYGLGNKFELLGERINAHQYLPQFDIFVLPSVKEGFPYVILEAMAAAQPIVATAVGGIPEILNHETGILVPAADPKALADAIKFLIENPEIAKRLGQNARERVKNFTLEKMVAETAKIYIFI